ncbi:hypothetical protein ACEQ8H_001574 [Pleosporales sp. CAS-2024a]
MPAVRPRASFEPIPPDFDVRTFVEEADNFQYADRISYEMIASNGVEAFEKLVLLHVIVAGKPLVVDGFEEVLDPWTFTPSWLRDNHGDKIENARNLANKEIIPLTIKHYLKYMSKLTNQFFDAPDRYRDKNRQRIYLKDIDCPQVWQDKLKEHIPAGLFYLNESTGEVGGAGALDEAGGRKGRGIARAGDLMSSLPPDMRAENLMCYIGHEGTYTPSHREMCASLGQNIMVEASGQISEDGQPEHPGSSLWFMTESKDRHVVSEYWLSVLGHDIEVENHFAQLIAWKKAPFRTFVVEQRPGDFILIPPLAPHQVWNRGTRTMKIAWNRTTVETLELAINEALPNSRVVCRDEQYKNKAIVYYTLQKYSALIKSARTQVEMGGENAEAIQRSLKIRHLQKDFKKLFDLYKTILLSEMFAPDSREQLEFLPYDSNVTCAYCRCNIFNRFLSCKSCKNLFSSEIEEPYDICMDCYCMGRSCGCQSGYTWVEQWKWKDLTHKYEEWRAQIIDIDGRMTEKTPLPLQEERRYLGKKTLAHVCQEQLRVRPFVDIKNPQPESNLSDDEPIVDEFGHVKKSSNKKSKQWLNFSVSNLNWLREEEGSSQNAMQRRLHQAEMDKLADPSLDPRYVDEDLAYAREGIAFSPATNHDGTSHENVNGLEADANDGIDSYYAGPDANGEIPRLAPKRGRDDEDQDDNKRQKKKSKKQKKKNETQLLQPKNLSGKQYQKEVQRKLLEDAKRDDRFLLVAARMKNKSKIVKLSLATGLLQRIRDRPAPERAQVMPQATPDAVDSSNDIGSILQSDVLPKPAAPKDLVEKERASRTFRIRVQEDEAYGTRKRNPEISGPSKPGRPRGSRHFEEITLDSDEDFGNDDEEVEYTGRSNGRASNWLARKNQGEGDLPTELPPDFRDGVKRFGREKDLERKRECNERRKTMPPKPKAGIRPPGQPSKDPAVTRENTANISDEDGIHEEDDQSSEALLLAQQAAAALEAQKREDEVRAQRERIEAIEREAQENLRAKMTMFDGSENDADGLIDDFLGNLSNDENEPVGASPPPLPPNQPSPPPEPVRIGPPQAANSIFAQPGMQGKKIKIVSAQSKANGKTTSTTTFTPPAPSFTPVNKRSKEIALSDSDSEDEIPATTPTMKQALRRPSMVPTRGGGAPKRGRGRPRKTM